MKLPAGSFGVTQHWQFIICMLALIFVMSRATAQIPPAKDFQQWTNVAAAWQVKPKLTITAFGELHIGNNVSQFDQQLMSAGVPIHQRGGFLWAPAISTFMRIRNSLV